MSSGARGGLSSSATRSSGNDGSAASGAHSPLAQLLHALNQPLTGLQCSMEVALAVSRTVAYYVERLREGLKLTERMRALVEAMREVTDGETEKTEPPEIIELQTLLREGLDDLRPVAEVRNIRIMLDGRRSRFVAGKGRTAKVVRFSISGPGFGFESGRPGKRIAD